MAPPVVLVLGAGPGIGANVAFKFGAKGYAVALVSRSMKDRTVNERRIELYMDLAHPKTIPAIFAKVEQQLGTPNVVVYNGCIRSMLPAEDPLAAVSFDDFQLESNANVTSALMAAKEAVHGFKRLSTSTSRTFIYTGNKLNVMADPRTLMFGLGRTAAAHMIWDCATAYHKDGFNFYFVDERLESGAPARELMDPAARADEYLKLSEDRKQGPWHYTFINNKGYNRSIDKAWDVNL